MNLEEAAKISGFAHKTLRDKARAGEFFATKPKGNRGGWEITNEEHSLDQSESHQARKRSSKRGSCQRAEGQRMTLQEASEASGFAVDTLRKKAAGRAFLASQPRGRRGGWVISEQSFRTWMKTNLVQRGNPAMKTLVRKGIDIRF
jgi:hypothetical protein